MCGDDGLICLSWWLFSVGFTHRFAIAPGWGWVLVIGGFEVIEEMKLLESEGVSGGRFLLEVLVEPKE
jgi:hypothetical protein